MLVNTFLKVVFLVLFINNVTGNAFVELVFPVTLNFSAFVELLLIE